MVKDLECCQEKTGPLPEGSGEPWNVIGEGEGGDGECLPYVELDAGNVCN